MTDRERDLLVARICSGTVRLSIEYGGANRHFYLRRPSRAQVYTSCELYNDVFAQSEADGLYDEDSLLEFLLDNELWTAKDQADFELLPKQMEATKVAMYQAAFRSNQRALLRTVLVKARAEYERLYDLRHRFDHLSCAGAAAMARMRYLVGVGLTRPDGTAVFTDEAFWVEQSQFLDRAVEALAALRVEDAKFRELARTEPWRGVWSGAKVEGTLFGCPPPDWTDEQRAIVNWSLLYDSIYASPERPPEDVIADDDMLDGWLILQRQNAGEGSSDPVKNEKIKNSAEVYLVADTSEDAKKVMGMNDQHARSIQSSRFAKLRKDGTVNELDMPDTAQRLRTEVTQKLSKRMAGR